MKTYLLDTNIASHIIKGDLPVVRDRLVQVPTHCIFISVITEAELLYGVAKRGHPEGLTKRVSEFLKRVEVLPWTSEVANSYGQLRAACEASGITLASMDMMIAAHARTHQQEAKKHHRQSVLVTRDRVFSRIPKDKKLLIEDWTLPE
ncbi:TPA: type II toxin-antitoxin system VapC family toxin [Klebsiella pneumoniae]